LDRAGSPRQMVQTQVGVKWLLEGFKYELEITTKPKTVAYYCGHVGRFLQRAEATGISDINLIDRRHIQSFFHDLLEERPIATAGNGSSRRLHRTERTRWPYYVSLRRFFVWAINEGYLQRNPLDGIAWKRPKDPPIEPYNRDHLEQMLKVLDHDWQLSKTPRQKCGHKAEF